MKKQFLLFSMMAVSVLTAFADKTIYVAPSASGTGTGANANNPTTFTQAFGALDATGGFTTLVLPSGASFQLGGGTTGYGRLPIPDNSKIIIEGNNSILEGTGNDTRIMRASTGCNLTLKNLTLRKGNAATSLGGAIFFAGDSLKIYGCIFEKDTADNGAAIGSRGKYIKISNCWFKGNRLRNSFQGGAISHTGTTAGGTLIVENTTFSDNGARSGNYGFGLAIITAFDGNVRNYLNKISITNCTFYQNNSGLNTHVGDAAIQLDSPGTTAPTGTVTTATLVNNTFYGNKNCAVNVKGTQQAVTLINNVIVGDIYANTSVSGVQDNGFIAEYAVAGGRPTIVAENNYIVAKVSVNAKVDDPALQSGNSDHNTIVTISSQNDIDVLGLSTALLTNGSDVPYLDIASSSSPLVEGGISSYSGISIPTTDLRGIVRGIAATGTGYDIGAYEYNGFTTTSVNAVTNNSFTISQSANEIDITSKNKPISVKVYLPNGQFVYTNTTSNSTSISKTQLPKGVLIFVINDGEKTVAKKLIN